GNAIVVRPAVDWGEIDLMVYTALARLRPVRPEISFKTVFQVLVLPVRDSCHVENPFPPLIPLSRSVAFAFFQEGRGNVQDYGLDHRNSFPPPRTAEGLIS